MTENVKVPDVAWTSYARFDAAATPDDLYTDTALEICVEIISPSKSLKEQMHKGCLYLQAGAEGFWLCNEIGEMQFFGVSGLLEHSRFCPDFPVKIEFRRRS